MGDVITQERADALLLEDMRDAVECVDRKVGPETTQNQFDAMVSLVFNIGCGAFTMSTLLRLFNAGQPAAAAREFVRWIYAGNVALPGLLTRRQAERDLFLKV